MPSDQLEAWKTENRRLEGIYERMSELRGSMTSRQEYLAKVMAEVEGTTYTIDPASIDKANRDAAYPR